MRTTLLAIFLFVCSPGLCWFSPTSLCMDNHGDYQVLLLDDKWQQMLIVFAPWPSCVLYFMYSDHAIQLVWTLNTCFWHHIWWALISSFARKDNILPQSNVLNFPQVWSPSRIVKKRREATSDEINTNCLRKELISRTPSSIRKLKNILAIWVKLQVNPSESVLHESHGNRRSPVSLGSLWNPPSGPLDYWSGVPPPQ